MTAMMVFALLVLLYGVFGVLGKSEVDKPSNNFQPDKGRRIDVSGWVDGQYQYVDAGERVSSLTENPSAIGYRWLLVKHKLGSKPYVALWLPVRQQQFLLPRQKAANEIQPFSGGCVDFRPPLEGEDAEAVIRCHDSGLNSEYQQGWQWRLDGSNVSGDYLPLSTAPLSVDGESVWLRKP